MLSLIDRIGSVIASAAKQSSDAHATVDCFAVLAMTKGYE